MQHVAHLPSSRSLLVPVVSLAIGAAGAVGVYAALDETDVTVQPTRVVVQAAPPVTAHDEASTASAIGRQALALPASNQPIQRISALTGPRLRTR